MSTSNPLSTLQVLIVDDEKTIQKLVSDILSALGFRGMTFASSGSQAVRQLSTKKFDFIITDWSMPDMEGIDLVRHVRNLADPMMAAVPIIMLTGNTEAHFVKTAVSAGINGYVIKPFSAEQLVSRIRKVIEQPQAFVVSRNYKGPDRRRVNKGPPGGVERRKQRKK